MKCDCYILRGEIYLLDYSKSHEGYGDDYGDNYGGGTDERYTGVSAGNALITLNLAQNDIVRVSRNGLDMTACAYTDLTGSTIDMTLLCTSMKNLAMAFRGTNQTTTSTVTTIEDEIYSSPTEEGFLQGSFTRFGKPVDVSTVELRRSDDDTVLLLNQDYKLTSLGFVILNGLQSGVNILANYTSIARSITKLDAFMDSQKVFKMTVVGKDISADSDEDYIFTFKKVRLSSMNNGFDVINDDFPELQFTGTLLRDNLASPTSSPFLTVEKFE